MNAAKHRRHMGMTLSERLTAVTVPVVYTIEKETYELPCEHPACPSMHKHLHNNTYETPRYEVTENIVTGQQYSVWSKTYHMKTRIEWVVLRDGVRVGGAHDTKREALAEAARRPTI